MGMAVDHIAVCDELDRVVSSIAADPVLRRALRYDPQDALSSWWDCELPAPTGSLGVRHLRLPSRVDSESVLGPDAAPARHVPLPLRLVLYGVRPATLVHAPERTLLGQAAWARSRGLYALMSPWQFQPAADPARAGFADEAVERRPAKPDSPGWRALLVTSSRQRAELGWLALLYDWEEYVGLLLGYPRCCVSHFSSAWTKARNEHAGDVAQVLLADCAEGAVHVAWQCNTFARVLGASLPAHFPCRLNCAQTVVQVSSQLQALARAEPETAEAERTLLMSTLHVARSRATSLNATSPSPADGWQIIPEEDHEVPILTEL